jgi:ankyrin repeat protein
MAKHARPMGEQALLKAAREQDFDRIAADLNARDVVKLTSNAVLETFFRSVQAERLDIIDRLIALGLDPNVRWRTNTALGGASRLANVPLIQALVDRGCDINAPGRDDRNPVADVCASASSLFSTNHRLEFEQAVMLLLKLGSDPNAKDFIGQTALDYAFEAKGPTWITLIRMLLEHGSRVDAALWKGAGCWTKAATLATTEPLQLLLDHGGNLDEGGPTGVTPLMIAVIHGREANVRMLLEHGASVLARDIEKKDVFHHAKLHQRDSFIPLLEQYVEA